MQVECTDFTYAAAVPAVEALLAQATPDAIVCANDLLAVAAINVLRRRGASVPGEVAVVGMDDTDIAELVNPTLTSVDLGAARRAATAAELLLDRLGDDDGSVPARRITVEPALTIRESDMTTTLVCTSREPPRAETVVAGRRRRARWRRCLEARPPLPAPDHAVQRLSAAARHLPRLHRRRGRAQ